MRCGAERCGRLVCRQRSDLQHMATAPQRDEAAKQRNRAVGMRTEERKQNYEQFKCRTDPGDHSPQTPVSPSRQDRGL